MGKIERFGKVENRVDAQKYLDVMKKLGFSTKQMAMLLGISYRKMSSYLHGQAKMPIVQIRIMHTFLYNLQNLEVELMDKAEEIDKTYDLSSRNGKKDKWYEI